MFDLLEDNIKDKIIKDNDCWIWTGCQDHGYGKLRRKGKTYRVHRYVYSKLVGEIPEGLEIDHLCRTTLCCNPAHLEPVTPSVNQLRGINGVRSFKCDNGHIFNEETTYIKTGGKRQCLICKKEKINAWYKNNREAVLLKKKERLAKKKLGVCNGV